MKAFDAGCIPRSAMVTVSRPPHARQPVTSPTMAGASAWRVPQHRERLSIAGASASQAPQHRNLCHYASHSVHRLPETTVHPGGQLTVGGQTLQGLPFPDRIVTVNQLEDAGLQDEEAP